MENLVLMSASQFKAAIEGAVNMALVKYNQDNASNEKAWTRAKCAEYLGISQNTLMLLVEQRQIPFFEIPGTGTKRMIRFHPAKIKAWEGINHPLKQINY